MSDTESERWRLSRYAPPDLAAARQYAAKYTQELREQLDDAVKACADAAEINITLREQLAAVKETQGKELTDAQFALAAAVELLKYAAAAILSEDHVKMGLALVRIRDSGFDAAFAKIGGK